MIYTIVTHMDASHRLKDYDGKCSRLHGHTWEIRAEFGVTCATWPDSNMPIDFKELKDLLNRTLPDHVDLNEFFGEDNPTAEFLAAALMKRLRKEVKDMSFNAWITLRSLSVWESKDCGVKVVNTLNP